MLEQDALTLMNPDGIPNLSGYRGKLPALLQEDHEGYCNMVFAIERGAYANVVAQAYGLSPDTFYTWYHRGMKDLHNNEDTLYARFSNDIRRAIAKCRMNVEIEVKDIDPKFWLKSGPGKWISQDWNDTVKHEGTIQHTGSVSHEGHIEHDGHVTHLTMDSAELASILEELSNAGLLTLDAKGKRLIEATKVNTPTALIKEDELDPAVLEALNED